MPDCSHQIPENIIKPAVSETADKIFSAVPGMVFHGILRHVEAGRNICLEGTWGFALAFYSWLKKRVSGSVPATDYHSSRRQLSELRRLQSSVWVRISKGSVDLKKAPENPWLRQFYPEREKFLIRLSDLLGMNGSWQWYKKGIEYAVIDHPIHPFYGVYFPTRTEHLTLFDSWLRDKSAGFKRAYDIGAGCGVLSFIMKRRGIENVVATDINPNAVFSINCDLSRLRAEGKSTGIIAEKTDLMGEHLASANDLVVCNPPWIPAKPEKTMDYGSYYPPGFYDRLFGEFKQKCAYGATIAIIFSDFAYAAGISKTHPVYEAIKAHDNHFSILTSEKAAISQRTSSKGKSWINAVRQKENLELFILRRV